MRFDIWDGVLCVNKTPIKLNFYRKPTDNDGIKGKSQKLISEWDKAFLRYFEFFCERSEIKRTDCEAAYIFVGKALPEGCFAVFFTELICHVYKHGKVLIEIKCEPYGNIPEVLPRAGIVFELPQSFDIIEWYGRGRA